MSLRLLVVAVLVAALSAIPTAGASADSGTESYQLHLELPNVSRAPNGDQVSVTEPSGLRAVATRPDSYAKATACARLCAPILASTRWM